VQVAEALEYAPQHGVLHRDIKPSNLLLDMAGTVWVTDFGLAKADDSDDLTNTGDLVGTLRFMAPERFEGRCDERSEVYSVGVTLYELLTLREAFAGANRLALLEQVRSGEAARPSKCDPRIPRDLETIVLKAMARDPAERYATAEALAEDLRRFLADRPIRARPTPWYERTWRWCRRNPAIAGMAAALLLLLTVVAVLGVAMSLSLSAALSESMKNYHDAVAAQRDGEDKLFQSQVAEARARRFSGRVGQRFQSLEAVRQAVQLAHKLGKRPETVADLRDLATTALTLPDLKPTDRALNISTNWWSCVHFDRALERYVCPISEGVVVVRRSSDNTVLATLPALPRKGTIDLVRTFVSCSLSPDGRFCAVWNDDSARVWDLTPSPPRQVLEQPGVAAGVSFTPDSRHAAVGLTAGRIVLFGLPDGKELRTLPSQGRIERPGHRRSGIAFGSTRLLACQEGLKIQVRDVKADRVIATLRHPRPVHHFAWHPDGQTLASVVVDSGEVLLWDAATGRQLMSLGKGGRARFLFFHPTADILVSVAIYSDSVSFFHARTGALLFQYQQTGGYGGLAQFGSTDQLAMAGRLWDLPPGREYRTLVSHRVPGKPSYEQPAVSPDGRLLAIASSRGVIFWDLATGYEVGHLPIGDAFLAFESAQALLTQTDLGLFRWQIRADPEAPHRLRIGPPESCARGLRSRTTIAASGNAGVIAVSAGNRGAYLLRRDRPGQRLQLGPRNDVRNVAVSPDGRHVATGNWFPEGKQGNVHVWDARTGKLVVEWPCTGTMVVAFSPDGRYLAAGCRDLNKCWLWAVDTWEEVRQLDGSQLAFAPDGDVHAQPRWLGVRGGWSQLAFAPDGDVLALDMGTGVIRLVNPHTGRELARLDDPNQDRAHYLTFTPDGKQLVTVSTESQSIHVWDLQRIRAELAKLGLDWDALPFPSVQERDNNRVQAAPLRVELIHADWASDPRKMVAYESQQLVARLHANPFDGEAHYRLGDRLLTGGKAGQAHAHLTAALAFRPDLDAAFYARAVAAFRLKRWDDAAADVSRVLSRYPSDSDARLLRAEINHIQKRFDDAVADLTAAMQTDPGNWRLFELRAVCYEALGKPDLAKADRDNAIKVGVGTRDPIALNNAAWQLVTGPPGQRDPARALKLIQQAVKQQPDSATLLNTLGVVQYRNGQYAQAVVTLEKSLAAGKGQYDAFHLFYLAMCHARLGDAARSRDSYDLAVQWWRIQQNLPAQHVEELRAFQAEAATLLDRPKP
jgi:WD40 repeat protein/tetratricopeptide (TPR) repeat protein